MVWLQTVIFTPELKKLAWNKKKNRKKILYTQGYIGFRIVVLFCLNFNILFENKFVPVWNATGLHAPLATYPQGVRRFNQKAFISTAMRKFVHNELT